MGNNTQSKSKRRVLMFILLGWIILCIVLLSPYILPPKILYAIGLMKQSEIHLDTDFKVESIKGMESIEVLLNELEFKAHSSIDLSMEQGQGDLSVYLSGSTTEFMKFYYKLNAQGFYFTLPHMQETYKLRSIPLPWNMPMEKWQFEQSYKRDAVNGQLHWLRCFKYTNTQGGDYYEVILYVLPYKGIRAVDWQVKSEALSVKGRSVVMQNPVVVPIDTVNAKAIEDWSEATGFLWDLIRSIL